MKQNEEVVKIRTKKGRIITLFISKRTATHLYGMDKFGDYTIVKIEEIDSLTPGLGRMNMVTPK